MAEEEKDFEKKPLLNEEEQDVDETKGEAPYTLPPPAYEPSIDVKQDVLPGEYKAVLSSTAVPADVAAAMPLPTYDQSEKYEKEGILELDHTPATHSSSRFDGTIRIFTRQVDQPAGSWGEFAVFFIVCLLFSWVGYIFACCLAMTISAQSGAAAGLGLSLIVKTIFVEFQPDYLTHMVQNMCSGEYYYNGEDYSTGCSTRSYNFLRLMFWIMGFLGLFLFARGLSVFCQSRRTSNTTRS